MNRTKITLLTALGVLGLLGFGLWYFGFKSKVAIADWKRNAIAKIEARRADPAWLEAELKKLAAEASSRDQPSTGAGWAGGELLTTQNGDWMICQSVSVKEKKLGIPQDLFIALGSDHRWYYSSFHFCIGKSSIMSDPQVENLADLVEAYWMVPFDGKSDDCLKPTWHGESWGKYLLDERRK